MRQTDRNRIPLLALLAANAISLLGDDLTIVVIPWFVLQTTGSATKTGITLATGTLPILLAGIFGGALADRFGYTRTSIAADLTSGLSIALIPLLYHTIGLAFWQLLILVFLGTLFDTPGGAARRSLIPDLADLGRIPLERANSAAQAVQRFALLLGPPVAGVLLAVLGASSVLWLDAASFAASALIVAVVVHRPATSSATPSQRLSYLAEVAQGFRFIQQDRTLLWLITMFALGSLVSEPLYVIVLPVVAKLVYQSAVDLGLMNSALAAGSLVGLTLYGFVGPRLSRGAWLIGGFLVRALSFWVLVLLPPLGLVLAAIAINAIFFEPINPIAASMIQTRVPAGIRGRVFGTMSAIGAGTLPAGIFIGGLLIGAFGLVPTLTIIAAASTAQAVGLLFIPALRSLDEPRSA
ncbi:MAG: MFS transporter [Dehalococcoidia bacterium]